MRICTYRKKREDDWGYRPGTDREVIVEVDLARRQVLFRKKNPCGRSLCILGGDTLDDDFPEVIAGVDDWLTFAATLRVPWWVAKSLYESDAEYPGTLLHDVPAPAKRVIACQGDWLDDWE